MKQYIFEVWLIISCILMSLAFFFPLFEVTFKQVVIYTILVFLNLLLCIYMGFRPNNRKD